MERYNNHNARIRKRILMIMSLIGFIYTAHAAEPEKEVHYWYSKLVKDNKTWTYEKILDNGARDTVVYEIKGDTAIGVYNYKKLYMTTKAKGTKYRAALREHNKVVYHILDDEEYPNVLYFFQNGQYADKNNKIWQGVETIDYMKCEDGLLARQWYYVIWIPYDEGMSFERIGAIDDLLEYKKETDTVLLLISCYEDGILIFNRDTYNNKNNRYFFVGIKDATDTQGQATDNEIYSITGIKAKTPKPGIYIRGGKKFFVK